MSRQELVGDATYLYEMLNLMFVFLLSMNLLKIFGHIAVNRVNLDCL